MQTLSVKKLLRIVKHTSWFVQGFNGLPLYLHNVASNTGWMGKRAVGANYSKFFLRIHESRAHWYYDELDLATIGDAYYKNIRKISQLTTLQKRHAQEYLAARRKTDVLLVQRLRTLSLNNLITLARLLVDELTMAINFSHTLEGIDWGSESRLKTILEKRGFRNHEHLQLLSSPTEQSFLFEAQIALGEIKKSTGERRKKIVERFMRDFSWIDNSYVGGKTLIAKDVIEKANALKHIPSLKDLAHTKRQKLSLIKKLHLSKEEYFVVKTIEICVKWHDDRKKYVLQTIERFEPVVIELSRRLGMTPEVFKYICPKELTHTNLLNKRFVAELKKRYPGCAYYTLRDRVLVYPGKQYTAIEKACSKNTNSAVTELKGMIANKGRVVGIARICRTIHDIPKVRRGEILVAFMTRPEFLPAMQKAAAFVTNEGGVTSHAAIVSREMGKPCIIGTKIATEVLKDGDRVEVDAYRGIITILK